MFDAFPYDEWSEDITTFWTLGLEGDTGTIVMTILGVLLMVDTVVPVRPAGKKDTDCEPWCRAMAGAPRAAVHHNHPYSLGRKSDGREASRGVQKEDSRVAPFMIALSIVCVIVVRRHSS